MPDPNAVSDWMTEVTKLVESYNGRLAAVEKTVDELRTGPVKEAADALEKIAEVEAEKKKILEKSEEERKKVEERREKWLDKVFSSQWFQLLMVGLVVALLNLLGVAWVAQRIALPTQPPPTQEIEDKVP